MDLGFSYQMCLRKVYFKTLYSKAGGIVWLGDNKVCIFHGIGTIRLKMFDDREFLLCNVRYLFELKKNLLSIKMFNDIGYCTKSGVLKILHGEWIMAKGLKCVGYIFR